MRNVGFLGTGPCPLVIYGDIDQRVLRDGYSMTIYNLSELAKNAGITLQEAGLAVMLKTDASSIALTGDEPVISDTYIGKASKAIAEYAVEKNSLQKEVERLQARVAELEVLVDKLMKR